MSSFDSPEHLQPANPIRPASVHGLVHEYTSLGVHENHIDAPGKTTWKAIIAGVVHPEPEAPYLFDIIGQYADTHSQVVSDAGMEKEQYFPVDGTRALLRLQAHEKVAGGSRIVRELEADVILSPRDGTPEIALQIGIALLQAGNSIGQILSGPYDAMFVGYPAQHETRVWQIHTDNNGAVYATNALASNLGSTPETTL